MRVFISAVALCLIAIVSHAQAPATDGGEGVFQQHCAACHVAPNPQTRAPSLESLRYFTPEAILNSLDNGKMQQQAAALSVEQRRAAAEFASGGKLGSLAAAARANECKRALEAMSLKGPSWNGWGNGVANTRFQATAQGRLTAADLPKLKLKWAFGYANVGSARAQPAVVGGRLFAASENGEVHALDPRTGCSYWTFKAAAGVRTALSVGPYKQHWGNSGYAVYFGDQRANAYAVDVATGHELWRRKVDDHAAASITGAPTVHDGRVFVPVQGLSEEGQGGTGGYPCCTFRGSLSALDANTGEVIWKTYTIDAARPRGKNKDGVQMWGPAGGSIWSSPTVDVKRRLVYAATGNNYADPPQSMTDAVVAFDLKTGKVKWAKQITGDDSWTMGCDAKNPDKPACPPVLGPDYDFSASPALTNTGGRDLLVLPQKSGMAFALDPDKQGAIVWQFRIGEGSGLGGQWGTAVDGERAYFGVGDFLAKTQGGMHGLNLRSGESIWRMPPQPKLCNEGRGCNAGQAGALTAIPGAVLNGALDGGLRAYSTKDGSIVWLFDTNREFTTVNGVKARGGSMDGPGPIVVDGMVFVNSGYGGLIGRPGNVLLAFELE